MSASFALLDELIEVFGFDSETAFLPAAPDIDAFQRTIIDQALHRLLGHAEAGCGFLQGNHERWERLWGWGLVCSNHALQRTRIQAEGLGFSTSTSRCYV